MQESEIGRFVVNKIDDDTITLNLIHGRTSSPLTELGFVEVGSNVANVLTFNTRSTEQTVLTAIHEAIHALGVGGSRKAEVLARLAERAHLGEEITRAVMREVITEVNSITKVEIVHHPQLGAMPKKVPAYGHFDWRTKDSSSKHFPGLRF